MDWGLLVPGVHRFTYRLRNQRLYPYKRFYWALVIINTLLRFCWTLSFVPFHYLSATGVLTSNFSSEAWSNILVPTIASAEIIRRTLWGLLRVEWEAIKIGNDMSGKDGSLHVDGNDEFEMSPMKVKSTNDSWNSGDAGPRSHHRYGFLSLFTSDMSAMNELQVFGELCLYTTTFAVLGLIIAAHRGTM
jgi:EXS family